MNIIQQLHFNYTTRSCLIESVLQKFSSFSYNYFLYSYICGRKRISLSVYAHTDYQNKQFINNLYFIVDCNHNQIIYSDSLSTNLKNWKTMTRNTEKPYTITSEGKIHTVIDTGNNRILTFKKLTIRLNLYKRLSFSC